MPENLQITLTASASVGIIGAILAWGFALYVAVVAQRSSSSWFLIALLIVDGFAVVTSGGMPVLYARWLPIEPSVTLAITGAVHQASDWALVAIYLPFIGITLPSGLVAPLKGEKVRWTVLAVGAVIAASMLVLPREVRAPLSRPFYFVVSLSLTWGFAAAIHAWISASSEVQRAQSKAFALAFGVRDVLWAATFAANAMTYFGLVTPANPIVWGVVWGLVYKSAIIFYIPLVAYGALRTQLFDIDLRIKRTLSGSIVASAYVAAFFLVSELATVYLSRWLGSLLGLVCSSALVFFLDPIQRAAQRLADAAMPNTRATPQYEAYRKLQVYEAALRAALQEEGISDRERRMLDSLVQSLGIDEHAARQLEADLRESLSRSSAILSNEPA
jgi:hypothetical protein